MDKILGHKPTTVPGAVVDTLAAQNQSVKNDNDRLEEREEITEVDETTLFGDTSDSGTVESSSTTDSSLLLLQYEKKSKRKKQSRGSQFEVVMNGVMKELMTVQEKNEAYLELEEKWMHMEEKIFDN